MSSIRKSASMGAIGRFVTAVFRRCLGIDAHRIAALGAAEPIEDGEKSAKDHDEGGDPDKAHRRIDVKLEGGLFTAFAVKVR